MKFYITTAIPYASKLPHVGNAYDAVLADALARYHRLTGDDVYFLTGMDEHGIKIQQQAEAEGITPQMLVDGVSGGAKAIWDGLNISYDQFIRTTESRHKEAVAKIVEKLIRQGDIYKSSYEGWYCTPDESFYTDSQAVSEGAPEGGRLCPDCGRILTRMSEEGYFFRLSKYGPRLLEYIEENPDFLVPESRRNEMLNNFLRPGLQDLCVTRASVSWGIPVTSDPKHTVYVWIDALSNYITGLGYDPDGESGPLFSRYWPCDLHVVGKDVVRFHFLYWPCFLMALGVPLYKQLYGHGWFNMQGGEKMSKSSGNMLDALELAALFTTDGLRYFLLREMSYAADGIISPEAVKLRYNTDLANDLGNLLSRSIAMAEKYFGSDMPACACTDTVEKLRRETVAKYRTHMEGLQVQAALTEAWRLIDRCNKYIDETAPWALAKDEAKRDELRTVIKTLLRALQTLTVLVTPMMPDTAEKMAAQLGLPKESRTWESLDAGTADCRVVKGEALFPRLV